MALEDNVVDDIRGGTYQNAYHKLAQVAWSDINKQVIATFSVFATPTAEAEGKEVVSSIQVDVTDLFPDIQKKIYEKAKLDPAFNDPKDV